MKVVILAGGLGTRLSEETRVKPKPMVEIGGRPIIWHIMKMYTAHNLTEFIICCGYKGYIIKEYFANYFLHMSDVTFDMRDNSVEVHHKHTEPWKVTVVDTGLKTMTGGRIKKIDDYVGDETFCLTYGDGVSDINLKTSLKHHKKSGKHATITGVQPPGRFGALDCENDLVKSFKEKPKGDNSWINGGFFVLEPEVFNYVSSDDSCIWEKQPLEDLAADGQLSMYRHNGFWMAMDTLRDKNHLDTLWESGKAPWKSWQ